MAKTTRRYSAQTLKLLFGLCGNECSKPDCTNKIIEGATSKSGAAILANICHIYAASDGGPRGKPGLTTKEKNAPSNLILLCGYHHPLVDKQWETYPAEMLLVWKAKHEAKYLSGSPEAASHAGALRRAALIADVLDGKITDDLERIRRSRHLVGFPLLEEVDALAAKAIDSEYSTGSPKLRARALAWCARLLALGENWERAARYLEKSKEIENTKESVVAEAFLLARESKEDALALLSKEQSAEAFGAAFRIVSAKDGPHQAIQWLDNSGIEFSKLNADGKMLYLTNTLNSEDWERCWKASEQVTEDDFQEQPMLLHNVAMIELSKAITEPALRTAAIVQVPMEAKSFPLDDDGAAILARRKAVSLLRRVATFLETTGLTRSQNAVSDHILWLTLRDPAESNKGHEELRSSMRDAAHSLRRLNLAIQFGVRLDFAAIERQIDQAISLSGKGTPETAFARFSLIFTQDSPAEAAEYLSRNREMLFEHLERASVRSIEIELLARSGQLDQATRCLAEASGEGLSENDQKSLRRMIAEASGEDPAIARRKQYEETGSLRDLVNLVNVLEEKKAWITLIPYANELFSRTGALEQAVRLVRAYAVTKQYSKLHSLLEGHQDLVRQSKDLQAQWAWSLYRSGQFLKAKAELKSLLESRNTENERALIVNISLASGDWNELISFTTEQWRNRAERSGVELLSAGQLAQAMGAPHARDLVVEAAERSSDDASVLSAAYFHATSAGWEDQAGPREWLKKAVLLSGEDGPLQSMSLKDIVERKPEWDKRDSSIWQQLMAGQIPMFGAARLLGRTITEFVLLPALANPNEGDARRRSMIYAYSGARGKYISQSPSRVALDVVSIVTLAKLGLLDVAISSFDSVFIPHGTLTWLFKERLRINFHQPSRVRDANAVRQLIARRSLTVLPSNSVRDQKLDLEVGSDLADLLVAASGKSDLQNPSSSYVIRSAPVHRLGSLMQEDADLSEYASLLCSCQAVVEKLSAMGSITKPEEDRALTYLKLHERRWSDEPSIEDGATLYLDSLAVTYLMTAGVLDKIPAAGLTAIVEESVDVEASRLLTYDALSGLQLEVVEKMRATLARGLESGKVAVVTGEHEDDDEDEDGLSGHPTFEVLRHSKDADAIIVDDRFLNRHNAMSHEGRDTPILTTLDLLEELLLRGLLTDEQLYSHRTALRRSGYQLIPVTEAEILHHINAARTVKGRLQETAELKAIRESFLKARMTKIVQLPAEAPWLRESMNAVCSAIRALWNDKDRRDREACSRWLIELLDVRGFSRAAIGFEQDFTSHAYATQILALSVMPERASKDVRKQYDTWISSEILAALKERQPDTFDWIVGKCRELVAGSIKSARDRAPEEQGRHYQGLSYVLIAMDAFATAIKESLLADREFLSANAIEAEVELTFGQTGPSFKRSVLFNAVRKMFRSRDGTGVVNDSEAKEWSLEFQRTPDPGVVIIRCGRRDFELRPFAILARSRTTRLKVFRTAASRVGLPAAAKKKWEEVLKSRVPTDDEFTDLVDDISATPVEVDAQIRQGVRAGRLSILTAVPKDAAYYERLAGVCAEGQTLVEFIGGGLKEHIKALKAWDPSQGYRHSLLLGAQPQISREILEVAPSSHVRCSIWDQFGEDGDIMSVAAILESGIGAAHVDSKSQKSLGRLAEIVAANAPVSGVDPYELISALTILCYGEIARARIHAAKPPFWKKLAAIAQASLIARCIPREGIDATALMSWAKEVRAEHFVVRCLMDMRAEPRWLGEFILPSALKNEIGGRVWHAARAGAEFVAKCGWVGLLLDSAPGSLVAHLDLSKVFYPGPLEGGLSSEIELPAELLESISAALQKPIPEIDAYGALADAALLFKVPSQLVESVVDAVVRSKYYLPRRDGQSLFHYLFGLATVAAVTRSERLADVIFILLRNYRESYASELEPSSALQVALIACASRSDLKGWASYVGDYITEVAFSDVKKEQATQIQSLLEVMCEMEPSLWITCGRGEAALRSVRG